MRKQEQRYEDDNEDLNEDDEDLDDDNEDLDEDEYQLSSSSIILAAFNQSSLGVHSSNPTHHCGPR